MNLRIMDLKHFIKTFSSKTKDMIVSLENYKELSGVEKKTRLDEYLKKYIETTIDNLGLNFIVKFILKKILIENISIITQCIFDLIKDKVEGITDN